MLYNIYCDESCHLENDNSDIMILGAVTCAESKKAEIYNEIRAIKKKNGLDSHFEIKWTKVSESKVEFYEELIDYFFNNSSLSYRGLVAKNKSQLNHKVYNQSDYNLWYYKMYFLLLDPIIIPTEEYRIFIDIKDTNGGPRTSMLHEVLCNNIYDFKQEVIRDIKQINSSESEMLQIADLLNGLLAYYHRGLYHNNTGNVGKKRLIDKILQKNLDLDTNTARNEQKFNLFIWKSRRWC